MDYEKIHNETLHRLQELVSDGKISEEVARGICPDFKVESEDEKIRKHLINYFKHKMDDTLEYWEGIAKEDEIRLSRIETILLYSMSAHEGDIAFIRNLRHLSIWRPSKEQLEELEVCSVGFKVSKSGSKVLRSLYEQLKQL